MSEATADLAHKLRKIADRLHEEPEARHLGLDEFAILHDAADAIDELATKAEAALEIVQALRLIGMMMRLPPT